VLGDIPGAHLRGELPPGFLANEALARKYSERLAAALDYKFGNNGVPLLESNHSIFFLTPKDNSSAMITVLLYYPEKMLYVTINADGVEHTENAITVSKEIYSNLFAGAKMEPWNPKMGLLGP
jgi:hypothetical protein